MLNTMTRVSQVGTHRSELAEGPLWHPQENALYWTDIKAEELLRYSPSDGVETICDNVIVGGFTIQKDGSLLLFMDEGNVGQYRNGKLSRKIVSLSEINARFNDVVADPTGRVLCGTMPEPDNPGRLYLLDHDGSFRLLLERVRVPNGLGFSPDHEHLYFTETNNHIIHRFRYNETDGTITERETFVDFRDQPGKPDGLTVDTSGNVWSAMWGSQVIEQLTPEGKVADQYTLPAQYVTSVTFGGVDLKTLYISTAQADDPAADDGGMIFTVETDVTGQAPRYSSVNI